jgi:hypothetical protein
MYPQIDLAILAARKERLRTRIRLRREECAIELDRAMRPVAWLEHAYAQWKSISPLVKFGAIPLGFLLKKKIFPKSGGWIGGLFRWGPMAFNLFKSLR